MYYIIGDMMHIKKFDPNKIKIDQHSLKNIPIYHIGYMILEDLKSINPSYIIINKYIHWGIKYYLQHWMCDAQRP